METGTFKFYKDRLIRERNESCGDNIRFNAIQYLCSFPRLNPVEMAASLMLDGYHILFDDSCISKKENENNKRKVERFARVLKEEQTKG